MISSLRQFLYPKEFRIERIGVSLKKMNLNEEINRLEDVMKKMIGGGGGDTEFIKDIATAVWRIEKRMEFISDHNKVSRVSNALNMLKDILKRQKIQIEDYTGEKWGSPYNGMPFEEVGGDRTGNIIMVEPRIFYDGKILQKGKLVIKKEDSNETQRDN